MITAEKLRELLANEFPNDFVTLETVLKCINSHLSELQAGNRERALRASEKAITDGRGSIGIIDAILSVVVPGSEEVERLKADLAELEKISGARHDALVHLNLHAEKLQGELAALRASMQKFKPGDVVYVNHNQRIRATMIYWTGRDSCKVFLDGVEKVFPFSQCYPDAESCRMAIPVEHLKGES